MMTIKYDLWTIFNGKIDHNDVEHTLVLGDMMTIENDLLTNPKMVRLTIIRWSTPLIVGDFDDMEMDKISTTLIWLENKGYKAL